MKIPFSGRVLLLGCGSVSQCLQPLLLKHLDMDFSQFTVMDMLDYRDKAADLVAAGAQFVQHQITPANLDETLATYLGKGDLLIDLAWSIEVTDIVQWCHDHDVLYVNTATELWDAYDYTISPKERTLYVRHMMLREMRDKWTRKGTTAVVEHGANPGLVSHWTKVALTDITTAMFNQGVNPHKHAALQDHLTKREWNHLAHLLGVKVIHISERDTQISNQPKQVNEFVNTWSVEGLYEEGIAPAEMGWGTHERILPRGAMTYDYGPPTRFASRRWASRRMCARGFPSTAKSWGWSFVTGKPSPSRTT